jgi:hypothetical protein
VRVISAFWRGRSPLTRGVIVGAVLVAAALGWWLGSPLFIRTTLNEALPGVTPAAGTAVTPGSPAPAGAQSAPPAQIVTVSRGELQFVDSLHHGKGPVLIVRVQERHILRFEDVAISNAPDVHVYLSRETGGKWAEATSLYLGPLKATNGSFNYDIPAGTDLAPYKSVVVWCRAFAVLVTWADLRPG